MRLVTYSPFQLKPKPLPFIICHVAPSTAMGVQMAAPARCSGIDTSSTWAPSWRKMAAPLRTSASTSASEFGWPKPSFTTAIFMPRTSPVRAFVYAAVFTSTWRGSSPSGPASTSSSSALSATVAVIGPV